MSPSLGVVFATGYASERTRNSSVRDSAVVLQKPYDERGLAAALKRAIGLAARRTA